MLSAHTPSIAASAALDSARDAAPLSMPAVASAHSSPRGHHLAQAPCTPAKKRQCIAAHLAHPIGSCPNLLPVAQAPAVSIALSVEP